MSKMKLKLFCMAVMALLMCSCSSVRHTSSAYGVDTKIVNFTVADVEIGKEKIQKTYRWNYNPFRPVSIAIIKSNITAQMLQENNADVLVEPQYIIEKRGWLRGGSVTVIGFPAKYKNFHPKTETEATVARGILHEKKQKKEKHRFLFF